jgi:preprotein translocase subunit SecD
MTTILGIYFALFVSLPVMIKLYDLVMGKREKKA